VVTRAGFRVAIGGTRTIRDRIGVATHLPRSRKVGIWDIMAVTVRGEGVRGGDGEKAHREVEVRQKRGRSSRPEDHHFLTLDQLLSPPIAFAY